MDLQLIIMFCIKVGNSQAIVSRNSQAIVSRNGKTFRSLKEILFFKTTLMIGMVLQIELMRKKRFSN